MSATMTRRDALIGSDYQILPFSQLPVPYQLAVAWYMGMEGDAWEVDIEGAQTDTTDPMVAFEASLPRFVEAYGHERFGITTITAQQAKDGLMSNTDIAQDFQSFEDYQKWYLDHCDVPEYGEEGRWPVILGYGDDEVLYDGYHRLHSYLRADHADVPVIFFPDRKHLQNVA
jgi:hypothetical protein